MKTWIVVRPSATIVNGAMVPTAALTPATDPTWCGGAYRDDAGTSFGAP